MSDWDQTGADVPAAAPGWDTMSHAEPAWQERTLRWLARGQRVFGRFALERILGRGGMGVVWLARDEQLGLDVALKFLPEAVAHDRMALEDLRQETLRSLRLTHPHIVRVYDFHQQEGCAAIAMEYVDGDTLSNLRLERPGRVFGVGELLPWIVQSCEALDYAHARAKIVHRDLKPANLMVNTAGEVRVADFGIARSLAESMTRVSKTTATSGTLVYMSPQQAQGIVPSPADDIYSLGATLYDLLTGKPPFYSGNIHAQIDEAVPPTMAQRRAELGIDGEAIPGAWEAVVAACLEKDPGKRPGRAGEVGVALGGRSASSNRRGRHTERGTPDTGNRRAAVMAIAFLLAAVGGACWWFGIRGLDTETTRPVSGAHEVRAPVVPAGPMAPSSDLSPAGQTDKVSSSKVMATATVPVGDRASAKAQGTTRSALSEVAGNFAVGANFSGVSGGQSALAKQALIECLRLRLDGIPVVESGFASDCFHAEAAVAPDGGKKRMAVAGDGPSSFGGSVMLQAGASFARSQNFVGLISCRLLGAYRLRDADGRDSGMREFQVVGAGFSEEDSLRNAVQTFSESELAEHLKRSK